MAGHTELTMKEDKTESSRPRRHFSAEEEVRLRKLQPLLLAIQRQT
jgi:hypothetical protein